MQVFDLKLAFLFCPEQGHFWDAGCVPGVKQFTTQLRSLARQLKGEAIRCEALALR